MQSCFFAHGIAVWFVKPLSDHVDVLMLLLIRIETKMHFSFFAKMRKACENGLFLRNFTNFREIQAKIIAEEKKFAKYFRKKRKIFFYVDTAGMVHAE
jgi:hypothetical protein